MKDAKLKAEDYVSVLGQSKKLLTITDSQNYQPQPCKDEDNGDG
jgi:hypothetical protein